MKHNVGSPEFGPPAISLLKRLVAAQDGGEHAVQSIIADALGEAGCEVETIAFTPSEVSARGEFAAASAQATGPRSAIVGRLPATGTNRASLLMFAHPDSEPVLDADTWSHAPFEAVDESGRIYGWGVADDLAGCAAAIMAIRHLAENSGDRGALTFASTPSKRSARGVAAVLQDGVAADAALYLHPAESGAGMREVKAVTPGLLEFAIRVTGRLPDTQEPGHTPFAHLAENPIDKIAVLIPALKALSSSLNESLRHDRIEAKVGRSVNLQVAAVAGGNPEMPGRMSDICELGCALSFPPGANMRALRTEVEAAIATAGADDAWLMANPPNVVWLRGVAGSELSTDHPLWTVTSGVVKDIMGVPPVVNPLHMSSDIRVPTLEAGIPCVGLGCLAGALTQNGQHDEWVDRADFLRMIDVTAAIAERWCRQRVDTTVADPI